MVNNRTIDVLFVPDVEGKAIDELKAHDAKKKAEDPTYSRTLKVVVTDGINRQTPEYYSVKNTRFGWLTNENTPMISLAKEILDLFRPAELMHCDNSGKNLMVGVVSERSPSAEKAGLYAFGITAAKGIKSNAIVIAREYAPGCYQILGMGAGQPNRKDAAMLAGSKSIENLQREFYRLHGKQMIEDEGIDVKGRKWEAAWQQVQMASIDEGSLKHFALGYRIEEDRYVKDQLGSPNVIVTSDAFFPKPDGLDEVLDTGVRNVISPGGSKGDAEVIARANEKGATLIHTGVRYFKH